MRLACPLRIHCYDNGIELVNILTSSRETMKNTISTLVLLSALLLAESWRAAMAADITARTLTVH